MDNEFFLSVLKALGANLPGILLIIGGFITAFFQYRAANIKATKDEASSARTNYTTAESAFRDDLLQRINDLETAKTKSEERADGLKAEIDSARREHMAALRTIQDENAALWKENAGLRHENTLLNNENIRIKLRLDEMESEFAKIEKKVFYRGPKQTPPDTHT